MDFEDYHKNGYGVFSLNDLISAEDIKEIDRLGDMVMTVPINDDTYQYILSVFGLISICFSAIFCIFIYSEL